MNQISIQNLTKIFGTKEEPFYALDDVSLEISRGSFVIFKGQSGSGKSTLLQLIASMSKPTSGAVLIDGQNYAKLPDDKVSLFRLEHIGFIFQAFHLVDELSVEDNIKVALATTKLNKSVIQEKIQQVLKLVDLESKKNIIAKHLSGGEKQRCAIARALVNNPEIIIADEPTANLDRSNSLVFIKIMKELKQMGKTIIIATHDEIFDDVDQIDVRFSLHYGKLANE